MKKIFFISTSAVLLTWATPILTNDTDTVVSRSGDVLVDSVNKKGIFQWLEGGFGYTNKKLSYDLTAFKVLRENKSAVRYLQTSLRRKGAENTFNIGFGTRNAINDARTTLIGANIFIDSKDGAGKFYTFGNKAYKRLSLGLELKTGAFDLSANMYRPMGSAVILGRKVMKGFDMTAKGNIPSFESLSVGLNTYKFDGVADKVEQGNKLIVEYKPNSIITIRGEYDKPKSSSAQTNVYAGFKFAFGTTNTMQQNSGGTAWHKRYDKVERSYEVKTAETAKSAPSAPYKGQISSESRSGSGKWGSGQTYTTDYKLKLSDTVDGVTETFTIADFTFAIVASQAGYTPTTANIVSGDDLNTAIDTNNGTIKPDQLTKGGTLLVKITRQTKGDLPQVVEYQNFTVDKQDYPIVIDSKYTSATQALANRLKTSNILLSFSTGGFGFMLSTAGLTSAVLSDDDLDSLLAVTKINDISDVTAIEAGATAAVIAESATENIKLFGGVSGSRITGNETEVLTKIRTELKNRTGVYIARQTGNGHAKKVLKLRIQIDADTGDKYNAYDDILYLVTAD